VDQSLREARSLREVALVVFDEGRESLGPDLAEHVFGLNEVSSFPATEWDEALGLDGRRGFLFAIAPPDRIRSRGREMRCNPCREAKGLAGERRDPAPTGCWFRVDVDRFVAAIRDENGLGGRGGRRPRSGLWPLGYPRQSSGFDKTPWYFTPSMRNLARRLETANVTDAVLLAMHWPSESVTLGTVLGRRRIWTGSLAHSAQLGTLQVNHDDLVAPPLPDAPGQSDDIRRLAPNQMAILRELHNSGQIGSESLKAGERLTKDALAAKLGLISNSHFATTLARLVEQGYIDNGANHGFGGGYFLLPKGVAAVQASLGDS
jgi:hypothetical protein